MKTIILFAFLFLTNTSFAQIQNSSANGVLEILSHYNCRRELEIFKQLNRKKVERAKVDCRNCVVYEILGFSPEQVNNGYKEITQIITQAVTVVSPYGTSISYECRLRVFSM